MTSTQELIKTVSIELLCQKRDDMISRYAKIKAQLDDLHAIAESEKWKLYGFNSGRYSHDPFDAASEEDFNNVVDRAAWRDLMERSGIKSLMDAETRDEWHKQLEEEKPTPFTKANVVATFERLYNNRNEMFEKGVVNVFKRLSWNYKSNCPKKFSKKIVIEYLLDKWGHTEWRTCGKIDDLSRVFHLLDGKPEPEYRNGTSNQMQEAKREGLDECENEYFRLKWYKKGTGHVIFKRPDLVKQMNLILAKHFPNALAA